MQVLIAIKQEAGKVLQKHDINHLKDLKSVILTIVNVFPKNYQKRVRTGVQELITNAIEHGNLGIDGNEKSQLKQIGFLNYETELNNRLSSKPAKKMIVNVDYEETEKKIVLKITDEGAGFNWRPFMEMDMMSIMDDQNQGRGIMMTKMTSFDEITYNEKGNKVNCIVFK